VSSGYSQAVFELEGTPRAAGLLEAAAFVSKSGAFSKSSSRLRSLFPWWRVFKCVELKLNSGVVFAVGVALPRPIPKYSPSARIG
jgi:hypothetical protein